MIDSLFSERAGKAFGLFGIIGFVICLGLLVYSRYTGDIEDATSPQCDAELAAATKADTNTGKGFRILSVSPLQTASNRLICIVVAGVTPKADGDAVELSLFMNEVAAGHVKLTARPVADVQNFLVRLDAPSDVNAAGAAFWRDLLRGGTGLGADDLKFGERRFTVGLSQSGASSPDAKAPKEITFEIYDVWVFWIGAAALGFLFLSFCSLARNSSLLRDNACTVRDIQAHAAIVQREHTAAVAEQAQDAAGLTAALTALDTAKTDLAAAPTDAAKQLAVENATKAVDAARTRLSGSTDMLGKVTAGKLRAEHDLRILAPRIAAGQLDHPAGPYSLGRTQMAFWLLLTIAGFIFIWLSVGQYYNLITGAILVLLGINGVTGLASVQMNDAQDRHTGTRSFLADILNDGDGPKLHRIQAVAWTVILGVIFAWNVFWNFRFVEFDQNLLLLIGVAQSLYLGFKYQEKSGG